MGNENKTTNGSSVWRWIAGILAAILLAGAPGIVFALRAPSPESVELIRERQQIVLQRLAGLDVQIAQLQQQIEDLQAELRRHEEASMDTP